MNVNFENDANEEKHKAISQWDIGGETLLFA